MKTSQKRVWGQGKRQTNEIQFLTVTQVSQTCMPRLVTIPSNRGGVWQHTDDKQTDISNLATVCGQTACDLIPFSSASLIN